MALDPDRMFARRCELKVSDDQLATAMLARGHRWTVATVSLAESGDRNLSPSEEADVEDLLALTPPAAAASSFGGPVRVVVDGDTIAITPEDASPADVVYALVCALDTVLHPQQ